MKTKITFSIFRTMTLVVLSTVLVIGTGILPTTSQAQNPACNLIATDISGAVVAFTVTGSGTDTLLISAPNGIQSISVGSTTNATVNVAAFTLLTTDPVAVTAAKIDLNLPASFSVIATDKFGHSITITGTIDCPQQVQGCTFTQGFWKNHPDAWPVSSLTLGTVTYTQSQLLSILRQPVKGNGLISLSHQLIAAKLNIANGASAPASVVSAIAAADALIGGLIVPPVGDGSLSTSSTSSLTSLLDEYNNGLAAGGPSHCD